MNNSASVNAVWQQNERTAADERNKTLCPPHEDRDEQEQEEDERDYAEEAFSIIAGSKLRVEKAHLVALREFYDEIIEEINEKVREAIVEMKR